MKPKAIATAPEPCRCHGCLQEFRSRNAVFTHLIQTNGACLEPSAYEDFRRYVLAHRKRQKVMILYGYIPGMDLISNGDDAATTLLQALATLYDDRNELTEQQQAEYQRINRSYGSTSRCLDILQQDEGTGAITEVLSTRIPVEANAQTIQDWLQQVNQQVAQQLSGSRSQLRVFGKLNADSQFNAEMDVGHRRIEYLFPVDLLVNFEGNSPDPHANDLEGFFEKFHSLFDGSRAQKENHSLNDQGGCPLRIQHMATGQGPIDSYMANYLHGLKKLMQLLTTNIIEVEKQSTKKSNESDPKLEKRMTTEPSESKGKCNKADHQEPPSCESHGTQTKGIRRESNKQRQEARDEKKKRKSTKKQDDTATTKFVLQRKRYHNFSPLAMAHEYLCSRRMDRFYHRGTLRFDTTDTPPVILDVNDKNRRIRPFLILSLTGDLFLNGQVPRVLGLFAALSQGLVDKDFVDCVFDEHYPHLVPTPPAPGFAMYAGEANYPKWEGKMKAILSPRHQDNFRDGWNDAFTIDAVEDWTKLVRQHAAQCWYQDGTDTDGRLVAEKKWTGEVLVPWSEKARQQLEHYRCWKASKTKSSTEFPSSPNTNIQPLLVPVDQRVPPMFQKVLFYLRQANESGLWPTTTPKRQLVMVSTLAGEYNDDESNRFLHPTSLSLQSQKAKNNVRDMEASAYMFEEGQGGASGSFSVGAMPGDLCSQPKGNELFPDLMLAAFELELALFPDREPSSTIAINRNAQFRPHTDSGAGAGQSTSLIVGLGAYSGGELVVEGEVQDIRYRPVEFNGWKQRHWTMPFVGERFSLVWFTPKGCEGVRGIDLCR